MQPRGPVATIPNGCDFDDFAGLEYHPAERFRITHAGSFFGKRDPRPFLQAVHESGRDVRARFLGDFRSSDREWAEELGLGEQVELIPYAPRSASLALQRDSEALLLLIPEAGGRGKGVLSGKVFEYLAAGRPILAAVPPDGAAAELIRETGPVSWRRPTIPTRCRDALLELVERFRTAACPMSSCPPRPATGSLAAGAGRGDGGAAAVDRMRRDPVLVGLFLATVATVSFAKLQWEVAGTLALSDVLTALFLAAFLVGRIERLDGRLSRTAAVALVFFAAFTAVYLLGFFNLGTSQALEQWVKGFVKFMLHFGFLVAGLALVVRRGERLYWLTLGRSAAASR